MQLKTKAIFMIAALALIFLAAILGNRAKHRHPDNEVWIDEYLKFHNVPEGLRPAYAGFLPDGGGHYLILYRDNRADLHGYVIYAGKHPIRRLKIEPGSIREQRCPGGDIATDLGTFAFRKTPCSGKMRLSLDGESLNNELDPETVIYRP